jgi:hypothetical protein
MLSASFRRRPKSNHYDDVELARRQRVVGRWDRMAYLLILMAFHGASVLAQNRPTY